MSTAMKAKTFNLQRTTLGHHREEEEEEEKEREREPTTTSEEKKRMNFYGIKASKK
jgi:hypothetical protein